MSKVIPLHVSMAVKNAFNDGRTVSGCTRWKAFATKAHAEILKGDEKAKKFFEDVLKETALVSELV